MVHPHRHSQQGETSGGTAEFVFQTAILLLAVLSNPRANASTYTEQTNSHDSDTNLHGGGWVGDAQGIRRPRVTNHALTAAEESRAGYSTIGCTRYHTPQADSQSSLAPAA